MARLAPEPSTPPVEAGTAALDVLDVMGSGPALATAMNGQGIPWNRTTVAKLETGRRESITVQELLALARVLEVPPVWLLVDAKAGTPVPIAEGVEVDPWAALLWLTGTQPLDGRAGTHGPVRIPRSGLWSPSPDCWRATA